MSIAKLKVLSSEEVAARDPKTLQNRTRPATKGHARPAVTKATRPAKKAPFQPK